MTDQEITIATAKRLLSENRLEESLAILKAHWLKHPNDAEAANLLSQLMNAAGRSEISQRLMKLSERMQNGQTDQSLEQTEAPKELFEAGFSLIDERQHELAAMLLNRCVGLIPNEPLVNYELGFALMSLKRFEQAIPYFEYAASETSDFDTCLNLVACYTMTRELAKASNLLSHIEKKNLALEPEQTLELTHRKIVLKRLEAMSNKPKLSQRDWIYILYGGVLLRTTEHNGREDGVSIGSTLAILKGLFEGLRIEPESIEFYNPKSRPLAQALAEYIEIPISSYQGPEHPDRSLLTMGWASDIAGPHKSFLENHPQRQIFAFALPLEEPLPVMPEIIGCLTHKDPFSEQEIESSEDKNGDLLKSYTAAPNVEQLTKSILYNARDLESDPDIIRRVQEAVDYYEEKRMYLLLANRKTFPYRCEYTAEIPANE